MGKNCTWNLVRYKRTLFTPLCETQLSSVNGEGTFALALSQPHFVQVRAKGIPHTGAPFPHYDPLRIQLDANQDRLLEQMKAWLEDPTRAPLPAKVISQRFYLYKSLEDNESYCAKHLNYDIIENIMEKKGELYAFYGGMKRSYQSPNGDVLMVKPDVVQRMACRTDWWQKGKRVFKESMSESDKFYSLSFPPGYVF